MYGSREKDFPRFNTCYGERQGVGLDELFKPYHCSITIRYFNVTKTIFFRKDMTV